MKPAILVERLLDEIALAPRFGGDEPGDVDLGPADVDSEIERDFQQEEQWYQLANEAGISDEDARAAGAKHGLATPSEAIDAAYLGSGKDFPKRGVWSGELVWIFLALRDRGILDAQGNPASSTPSR